MAKETMRVEICEDDDPESKLKAMWIKGDHLRVSVIVDHCGGKQLNKVVEVLNRLFKPLWWLSLELYYNDFIPDSVWDLANVDELCINHNLRAMPPEIIKLTKLRKLGIEFNPFKKFPVVVCRLEQLEELSCYNCHLSDIPSSFASLRNLLELHLGVNDFEQFPEVICELRNLRRLWIYANKLSSLPRSFANLQELRELGASENRFKDFPSVVCELPNLEHLFLDGNQLSELPLAITKLVRLKYLNLSRNSFTSFPLFLGDLPRLSEFYSSGNPLQGLQRGLENVNFLPFLQQRRVIPRLSAIIGGGFFCEESNAWTQFLVRGLYDPRLFLFIFDFALFVKEPRKKLRLE